ncbi:MAG TPA: adenylosuccinate synthetase, partial [Bryobacteraceae bacterium]|nr:adenylosuccinate synthetase [Bryobacteraceae bacterium]
DSFREIPVCTGYKLCGKLITDMPATTQAMAAVEPVYENLPGWGKPTAGITKYSDLPARARDYLQFLAEQTGVEVGAISTGPERSQTIVVPGSKLEKLL